MKQRKNIPNLDFSDFFNKQLAEASDEIKAALEDTIELFLEEPHHPALRNHALKEKFSGYKSIDVTRDYRAVFKQTTRGEQTVIEFYLLGTHKELYG
jgi:addiction module RelE/StbE family toxin